MSLVRQIFTATYNGVPFLVDSSEMRYGRKTQTFEYPNRKYRYVEDLGENLRVFDINAIITGDDDYLIYREAFIIALQRKGIGVLTHPFYGLVFVVVKNYTVNEDMTTLGECKISITFEESRPNIYPISGESSIFTFIGMAEEIAPYLAAFLVTKFTMNFKKNATDAANKCLKLNNSLQPLRPVSTEDNALNDFVSQSNTFANDSFSLVQGITDLPTSISNLLTAYNNLGVNFDDSYTLSASAYYFGDDDIYIKPTTPERLERINNRLVLNSFVNANLLIFLYQNAIQLTYLNDEQINQKENDIEEKYQYLMQNNNLDSDTLYLLNNFRNSAKKFFNNLRTNVSHVITVTINPTPLSVLLYNYYENFDNESEIISLNSIINTSRISGDIKMLTEQ